MILSKGGEGMEKLYTIKEAAELLKTTRQSIYNWNKKGLLKFVRVGEKPRITESALKQFIKED